MMQTRFVPQVARLLGLGVVAAAAWLSVGGSVARAQAPAAPAALPPGISAGPTLEGISEYELGNGLKVLLLPDASSDTITTIVTYLVGSRREGYGETGMAHLLEHMLFKGTPAHPDIKGEMMKHGARFNGTTSYDRTNYFETFPASSANLQWALELEADRMVHSTVARADLDSEMTVVRNEFESGENSPLRVLLDRMSAAAYIWHAYGRPVIGSRSDIENVPIERLQRFYRTYYEPDNATVLIVGRFDPSAALEMVARDFGPLPRPGRRLESTYTVEPTQDGERSVTLRRAGELQAVAAMYHIPPGGSEDYAAVELLTQVLSAEPPGRLHKALVEKGLAANVFGTERQQREAGTAYFGASLAKDAPLDPAQAALLETVEGFASNPVTDEELERARQSVLAEYDKLASDPRALALALSEFEAIGDWRYLFLYRDRIRAVSREDLQRAALRYLKPQNRTLGVFIPTGNPDRAEIPPVADLPALLQNYHPESSVAAGEAFDPTPQNIDQRTRIQDVPNGIRLAMLPKKTRGSRASLRISLHWGDEAHLRGRGAACSAAGAMLTRGTLHHSRAQLSDALDRLGADVSVSLDGASLEAPRQHLGEALSLVIEMLREPSFPAEEFEQMRRSTLTTFASQKTDPGSLAGTALSRRLNPYPSDHPFYVPSLEEREARWRAVDLAQARACYEDMAGASGADVSVVGDFEPEEIAKQVGELLGSWRSPLPYARIPMQLFPADPAQQLIETPDKANAVYRAGLNFAMNDADADFPALYLANYLIGGSPGSRLWARLREKEGLSYNVQSQLMVGSLDAVSRLRLNAIYAPQNRTRVETAVREELERALKDGFTEAEVAEAKHGLLEARRLGRNQDGALAGRWADFLHLGRSFAWDAQLDQALAGLTPDQLLGALRRHIRLSDLSVVRAGDFAGSARKAAPARAPQAAPPAAR
jgi:zinc protease